MKFTNKAKVAIATAATFGLLSVIQILLATGLLPGNIAYGGSHATLPTSLRISSALAAVLLLFFAYASLRQSGIAGSKPVASFTRRLYWFIPAYMVLNTIANLASKSGFERLFFGIITIGLSFSTFWIAKSSN